jgi:hypothetical protein
VTHDPFSLLTFIKEKQTYEITILTVNFSFELLKKWIIFTRLLEEFDATGRLPSFLISDFSANK